MLVVNSVKKNKSKKRKLAVLNIKVKVRESSISNVSLKLKKKISKVYTFKMSKEASVPHKKESKKNICLYFIFVFK